MPSHLLQIVADARKLNSRVVLIVGANGLARTSLLRDTAAAMGSSIVNLGLAYSRRLLVIPRHRRPLEAGQALRDAIADRSAPEQPLFLDRLEVLFESSLRIDPLDALRHLGHARTVVANWPGSYREGRLFYAPPGHPEHRDEPTVGITVHEIY